MKILIPSKPEHIAFFLPVERYSTAKFGNPSMTVENMGLHEKYNLACIFPEFENDPWINKKQEYDIVTAAQELSVKPFLIGFSKGGLGAMNLLLRNPDIFSGAISWDAPLMMDRYSQLYGSRDSFREDIDEFTPSRHVGYSNPAPDKKVSILGSNMFTQDTEDFHNLLLDHGIPHYYDPYMPYRHHWNSPWMDHALKQYLSDA